MDIPIPPTGPEAPRIGTGMTLDEAVTKLGINLGDSVLTIEGLEKLIQYLEGTGSDEISRTELFFLLDILGNAHSHFETPETFEIGARYHELWGRLARIINLRES